MYHISVIVVRDEFPKNNAAIDQFNFTNLISECLRGKYHKEKEKTYVQRFHVDISGSGDALLIF